MKHIFKEDEKDWLEQKGAEAWDAADRDLPRMLYHTVKDLKEVKSSFNVPIMGKDGRILQSRDEQDARWVEHFN